MISDWPRGVEIGPGARGHKFGMTEAEALEVCRRALASEWVELRGLHHHAGRWTNDLALNQTVVREQVELAARLRDALRWTPQLLNMGGGLAWGRPEGHGPDNADRTAPDAEAYAEALTSTLRAELDRFDLGEPELMIEPGRALASNIGVLLARVGMVKSTPGLKTWVNVDASQNHLANILTANWYYHAVAARNADPRPVRAAGGRSGRSAVHLRRDGRRASAADAPARRRGRFPGRRRLRRKRRRRRSTPSRGRPRCWSVASGPT